MMFRRLFLSPVFLLAVTLCAQAQDAMPGSMSPRHQLRFIGPTSPVVTGQMAIERLFASGQEDRRRISSEGSLWVGTISSYFGISKSFDSTYSSASAGQGPDVTLFAHSRANGSNNDVVAIIGDSNAIINNSSVFGANFICRSELSLTGVKCTGTEIDVVPATGVTLANTSIGLAINVFNGAQPAPAIQIGGVNGGTWANGLICGALASNGTCLAPNTGAAMDSLLNSGAGTYTTAAAIFSNNHKVLFSGTAAAHAFIYNDAANNLNIVGGSASTQIRNNANSANLITIPDAGNIVIPNRLQINGGTTDNIALAVLQTSAAGPAQNIFAVLNNGATTTYFAVDPNGSSLFNAKSGTDLAVVFNATTAGHVAQFLLRDGGTDKWNVRKTSTNQFDFFSQALAATVFQLNDTGMVQVTNNFSTPAPTTKTTNYSQTAADSSLIFNGAGTITLTLQSAASFPGRWLFVKTIAAQAVASASSNVVPIGSSTAGTAILTNVAGKWAWLQSDGTNWVVMAAN